MGPARQRQVLERTARDAGNEGEAEVSVDAHFGTGGDDSLDGQVRWYDISKSLPAGATSPRLHLWPLRSLHTAWIRDPDDSWR